MELPIPDFFKKADSKSRDPNATEASFLALMSSIPGQSWFVIDGEKSLLIGINLPTGSVTLSIPASFLTIVERTGASLLPIPPALGGSSPEEFVDRLVRFANR